MYIPSFHFQTFLMTKYLNQSRALKLNLNWWLKNLEWPVCLRNIQCGALINVTIIGGIENNTDDTISDDDSDAESSDEAEEALKSQMYALMKQ